MERWWSTYMEPPEIGFSNMEITQDMEGYRRKNLGKTFNVTDVSSQKIVLLKHIQQKVNLPDELRHYIYRFLTNPPRKIYYHPYLGSRLYNSREDKCKYWPGSRRSKNHEANKKVMHFHIDIRRFMHGTDGISNISFAHVVSRGQILKMCEQQMEEDFTYY